MGFFAALRQTLPKILNYGHDVEVLRPMQRAIAARLAQGRQDTDTVDDIPDETYAAEDDVQPSDEPDTAEDDAITLDEADGLGLSDPDLDIFSVDAAFDEEKKSLPEGLVEIDARSLLDDCNGVAQKLAEARGRS